MEFIAPELKFISEDIKTKSKPPVLAQFPTVQKGGDFVSTVIKNEMGKRSLSGYSNVKHSDIYSENTDGSYTAKYDSYDISGGNQEEYFAQKQTTGEKWTNGTIKLLGKTAVATLGGTLGVVDSLVEGIYKGSLSEAYGTNFNKWLDGLHTQMDYKFANYYTEQDREASLLGQMGQANFWADKVFGGISFTAGTLVSEGIWGAATGGASLLSSSGRMAKLANWTAKGLGGEGKLMKALNTAKATSRGSVDNMLEGIVANEGNLLKGISEGTKAVGTNYYKAKKLGEIALVAIRSAGFESGMEARQYMNSTEYAWREKYNAVNGKEPSLAEYSQFKEGLTNSANAVFGANTAIVGFSNVAQSWSALLGRSTNPALGNSLVKRTLFGVGFDKTVEKTGKITYTALEASKKQIVAGRVWGVLGSAVTESQEEMGQKVVSLTAENYMLGGLDPKHIKTTYGMAEAFTDALHNTYGTKEGWSEGLVGAIVGVFGAGVHSKFKFGEVTAERKNVEDVVTYANGFTAENHFNNLVANSKILQAQEDKEGAISRGDIVGEQLADTASSIAFIERNQAIGNTKEAVNDLTLQMDAISNEALAEELGLGKGEEAKQQAKEFKAQKIAEFKSLAETHEKNLNYAEALFGETEIAGVDKDSTRALIRAVATTITMGDKSMKTNQGLVSHVIALVADSVDLEGVTDAMSVQQILDLAPREKTLKLLQLNREHLTLDAQEKELRNKEFEASKLKDTEDNKVRTNTLTDLAKQLQDLQNKKEKVRGQKQLALDAIGVKTYTDENVTVEMFDAQNENLTKLKNTLDHIRKTNPERYSEIKKGLEAQSKAVAHIKGYQKTIEMISDPKSRTTVLNGWLKKLLKGKTKLSEGMAAYVTDVLTNQEKTDKVVFQDSTDITERANFRKGLEVSDEYKQQVGKARRSGEKLSKTDSEIYEKYKVEIEKNAKETIEVPQKETEKAEVSNLEKLKNKVREIISSNDYLTGYFGKDLTEQGKSKPSEKDIKRYEELLSKIDRRVESNISKIVSYPENYYDGQLGLKNAEIDELVKLQTVLNDWLTLEGALDKDNQSVAQLLDLISSLESVKANENVLKDVTTEDYKSVLGSKSEEESNTNTNSVRGLQTPTEALVTVKGGNMRISHVRTETLESFFPGSNLTKNVDGSFEIALASGKTLKGQENDKGGQDIDLEDWNAVEAESNVLIKNFGTKPSAISQSVNGTDIYENVASDFDFQQTDGTSMKIDKGAVNNVKNGDTLELHVSTTDVFNSKLEKGERAKQLHIYVMKGGKLLGSLPASNKTAVEGIGVNLVDLRKEAYDFWQADKTGKTLIKLPHQMKAQITFMGVPNLTLHRSEEGTVETKTLPFTGKSLQHVVGQGYILDGVVTTTAKIDVNQFTRTISKGNPGVKVPFIVFNYKGKNVSFPVKLNTKTSNKAENALNGENSLEKAKSLVNTLLQNNMKDVADSIDFTDPNWMDSKEVEEAMIELSKVEETISIETFASSTYSKERLRGDAEIAIDLENRPFGTNKVMLTTTDELAPDVLGYREMREAKQTEARQVRFNVVEKAKQIQQETNRKSRDFEATNSSEIRKILTDVYTKVRNLLGNINSVPKSAIVDGLEGKVSTLEDLRKILNHPNKGKLDTKELAGKVKAFDTYKTERSLTPKLYELLGLQTTNSLEALKHYTSRLSFTSAEVVGRDTLAKIKELVQQKEESDKSIKHLSGKLLTEEKRFNKSLTKQGDVLLEQVRAKVRSVSDFEDSKAKSVKATILEDAMQEVEAVRTVYKAKLLQDFPASKEMVEEEGNYENVSLLKRLVEVAKTRKDVTVDYEIKSILNRLTFLEGTSAKFIEDGILVDVLSEVDFAPDSSDIKNVPQLDSARKLLKVSKAHKAKIGVQLFNDLKQEIERLDSLESTVKKVNEQIKNSKYYKDVDPALLIVDENGEIENPAITQEAIIEELGGIKDFEEFEEKAQGIETLNKSGQYLLDLFEETKDLERVEVKVETEDGLEDKLDTSVRDTLVATMRDSSNGLLELVQVLNSYSPQVLKANPKEVEKLLKEIEDKALDHNIDFRGLSGILEILPLLQRVLSPNANEEDFNSFVEAYLKGKGIIESPKQKVIKVAPQFKGKKLIVLESESSQYKLFKDEGLIEVQEGVYLKTDGHEQTLEEVERKVAEIEKKPPLLLLAKNKVATLGKEEQQTVLVSNGMELSSTNLDTLDAEEEVEKNNEQVITKVIDDNVTESEVEIVAEELGVSSEEAKVVIREEVKREVYKKGKSTYNLSDKVKSIIKNIVKFLTAGALLFTVYYSTGNVRDSATRKINDYLAEEVVAKDTISFNETTFSVTSFNGCNAYVSNQLKHTVGALKFDKLGYYGDAWTATANTVRAGKGTFVFNIFKGYEKKTGLEAEEITKEINNLSTNSVETLTTNSFKEGDVVNLFYEGSNFTKEAYEKGKDILTSHVGIVKSDSKGTLVLEHNIHGIIKKDNLGDLIGGKLTSVKGKMLVSAIMRPSFEKVGATVKEKTDTKLKQEDVITEDAEYELDTVKKFIHYKNHFGAPNVEGKDPTPQLKKVGGATLKPKKSIVPNYFNKQLRGEHKALENLVFDSKGITLRHLDKQSVDVMNDYLKGEAELKNYFLLSVNTNFEVYSDEVAQVSMRDVLYNGGRLEQFKGDSTPLGKGDIRANTVSNFITLGNDNFERISGDLFAKIGKNESEFLEVGVEQPKLSIDPAQYTSQPIADSGVVTHNNYTNEGGFITEEKNTCSS